MAAKKAGAGKLAGQTFVVTGTLKGFERADARKALEALGGSVSGSISGKTTAVVVGADPGSKAAKGKKLGLKILNEAAFKRLVGSSPSKKKAAKKKPAGRKKAPAGKKDAKRKAKTKGEFGGKLSAYTFVIAGKLKSFSQAETKAAIEFHGGKVVNEVSSKVNCVIVSPEPSADWIFSGAAKADELGLMRLDEAEFKSLVGAAEKATKKSATKKKSARTKAKGRSAAGNSAMEEAREILMARTLTGQEAFDLGVLTTPKKTSAKRSGGRSRRRRLSVMGNSIRVESAPVSAKLATRIKKQGSISHDAFEELRDEAWGLIDGIEAGSSVSILVDDVLSATFEIDQSAIGSPKAGSVRPKKKSEMYFVQASKRYTAGDELGGDFDLSKLGFDLTTQVLPNGWVYEVISVSYAGDELEYEDADPSSWDPVFIDAKGVECPFSVDEPEDDDD
jgi:BRCT domain type II-containing protein